MLCQAWAVTVKGQRRGGDNKRSQRAFVYVHDHSPQSLQCSAAHPGTCAFSCSPTAHTCIREKAFPHRSHADCISIRGQERPAISQGSDSQNGPSGALCHSAPVTACPIDPAQLSKPMRDTRLRSRMDEWRCQELWRMYNLEMMYVCLS